MIIPILPKLLLLFTALFVMISCSKDENLGELESKGTHRVSVFNVKIALGRVDDIRVFVSEEPFKSYDTFKPIGSVAIPKNNLPNDSINVNVSKYVGKALYFTTLRKYLLSDMDKYYPVGKAASASASNKIKVEEDVKDYKIVFAVSEPRRAHMFKIRQI